MIVLWFSAQTDTNGQSCMLADLNGMGSENSRDRGYIPPPHPYFLCLKVN